MRGPWRVSGVLNAALAVAICVAVVAVALPAKQSAPLTVAELAPRAVQTKVEGAESRAQDERQEAKDPDGRAKGKDADEGGDGDGATGKGNGTGGRGKDREGKDDENGATDSEDPDAPEGEEPADTTDETDEDAQEAPPRRRRCVGNPPRQTEDPQSPPCVAGSRFDTTNNGGATSKGVTADEIRVVVGYGAKFAPALEGHFNSRYEFYGRKLRIIAGPTQTATQQTAGTVDEAIANAAKVDEDFKAFAATYYMSAGPERFYYNELARRGIISVHDRVMSEPASALAEQAPYRWSVLPALDQLAEMDGAYICNGLAGKAPQFGRLAQGVGGKRVFGLVVSRQRDGSEPNLGRLRQQLEGCGAKPAVDVTIGTDKDTAGARQAITKFRAAGVTTVIQATNEYGEVALLESATGQAYFPEWLFSPANEPDDSDAVFYDPIQVSARYGVQPADRQLPLEQEPAYQAIAEGDPANAATFDRQLDRLALEFVYRPLVILASGIQGAGPDLNPQTFAQALQSARFPNPGANGAPYHQAAWTFGPGDFNAVDDTALGWVSQTTQSYETGLPGAICWARGGTRYTAQNMPPDNGGVRSGGCR